MDGSVKKYPVDSTYILQVTESSTTNHDNFITKHNYTLHPLVLSAEQIDFSWTS